MKALFFILFLIWFGTPIFSLALGPFVGLSRQKLKRELIEYWNLKSTSAFSLVCRRVTLLFCWAGFLFPVIFPLPGFIVSLVFVLLT